MPTFPSKCRKESEKPTGSSRDKIDGKERGPLQLGNFDQMVDVRLSHLALASLIGMFFGRELSRG